MRSKRQVKLNLQLSFVQGDVSVTSEQITTEKAISYILQYKRFRLSFAHVFSPCELRELFLH